MEMYDLENDELQITVSSKGAELKSLKTKKDGVEHMWSGDADIWGRVSPVLFPIVGALNQNKCPFRGKTYEMTQHGFARDMEFCLKSKTENEIWFQLTENLETLKKYPFPFVLEIGYRLEKRGVKVSLRVINEEDEPMYFSIGAHPGFAIPAWGPDQVSCYVQFEGKDAITVHRLSKGLVTDEFDTLPLTDGLLPVTEENFAKDALIIENQNISKVSLLNEKLEPVLKVTFSAPLFGVWTPPGKYAPFICIEPWYGRADADTFTGQWEEREWGNCLTGGKTFQMDYQIEV